MHTHTYTEILSYWKKRQKLHILDIPDIPPVYIGILKAEITCEKPQNSPPQRPDPSQAAAICRGSRSSP